MEKIIMIRWLCATEEEALNVVNSFLENKWIACANIYPVLSLYTWKMKKQETREILVEMKTTHNFWSKIQDYIQKQGSYDIPALVAYQITEGSYPYLKWIGDETSSLR